MELKECFRCGDAFDPEKVPALSIGISHRIYGYESTYDLCGECHDAFFNYLEDFLTWTPDLETQ